MAASPSYAHNGELFADFYSLQGRFTGCLASRPSVVRLWLEGLPPREPDEGGEGRAGRGWRTARLSLARRRELSELVRRAEEPRSETEPLAGWLLAAVPVGTYFQIAACAESALRSDGRAEECHRRLIELRDRLFHSNYGLAKAAAKRRRLRDYPEMLSAASSGLLDAIDRYVPDAHAARFAYFAGYWIRYHLARQAQKCASVVTYPINQYRIGRRIERLLRERADSGSPTEAELCAELRLGRAALRGQRHRPVMVSIHAPAGPDPEGPAMEQCLSDPLPPPAALLEEADIAERLRALLRARADPAARVMLAAVHGLGGLGEAAGDFLAALQAEGARALRVARPMGRAGIDPMAAASRPDRVGENPTPQSKGDTMTNQKLSGKKIAILATDGFEQSELQKPREALKQAGAATEIIAPHDGQIKGWNMKDWGEPVGVDVPLAQARPDNYDGLLLPGGVMNPDHLRMEPKAVEFVRSFFQAGKPVAAICHGPQLLIEAGVARGRRLTSFPSLKTDLKNAGADWIDEVVVTDQGLVTSRKPDDIPRFNEKMIEEFAEGPHAGQRRSLAGAERQS